MGQQHPDTTQSPGESTAYNDEHYRDPEGQAFQQAHLILSLIHHHPPTILHSLQSASSHQPSPHHGYYNITLTSPEVLRQGHNIFLSHLWNDLVKISLYILPIISSVSTFHFCEKFSYAQYGQIFVNNSGHFREQFFGYIQYKQHQQEKSTVALSFSSFS